MLDLVRGHWSVEKACCATGSGAVVAPGPDSVLNTTLRLLWVGACRTHQLVIRWRMPIIPNIIASPDCPDCVLEGSVVSWRQSYNHRVDLQVG